jgi:Trk-type K+ transport system membrane component
MRSTNRAERTTGYYTASAEQQQEKDAAILQAQLTGFMSQNSTMLLLLFFLILLAEEYTTSEHDVREHRFLFILFEFCSAYGTVGLSMSDEAASRSGRWSWPAKCSLIAVMFLGRLRGLPDSIDPAFNFCKLSGTDDEFECVGCEDQETVQRQLSPQSLLL